MARRLRAVKPAARRTSAARGRNRATLETLELRALMAVLPAGFVQTTVLEGLASPTTMEIAPDGRIFVAEQGGALRVIKNGQLLDEPFLTVDVDARGERGLVGVVFDPEFDFNQYVYVYYTSTDAPTHNRLSRFTAHGDHALPGSETVILDLDPLSGAVIHNSGAMHFAPDGTLYVAVGDNYDNTTSQSLSNPFGKMLRINKDGSIPEDNPFVGIAGAEPAIWAYGLRNPFTFNINNAGDIFINDVGFNSWEEINRGVAGANYGWPITEGPTADPRFTSPIFAYPHGANSIESGCAIAGGVFYEPENMQFPAQMGGDYFFADFCNHWIRRYDLTTNQVVPFASDLTQFITDVDIDGQGNLYYLSRRLEDMQGGIYRIQYAPGVEAAILTEPADVEVAPGQNAVFSVVASGRGTLSYQWQRNGAPINGATLRTLTVPNVTAANDGARYRVVVTDASGSVTSREARLTVLASQPPVPEILTPMMDARYTAGDTITFTSAATDPEDGALPENAFTWWVDFRHDEHAHPFLAPVEGASSGSFTIPTIGETASNVWYRIHVSVTDSSGVMRIATRDVLPNTAAIEIVAAPSSLELIFDGRPVNPPIQFVGVAGVERTLEAPLTQTVHGTTWTFTGWSNGSPASFTLSTPGVPTKLTAGYEATAGHGLWIKALYRDVLGREAGANEIDYYSRRIEAGVITETIVAALVNSAEVRSKVIATMYNEYLGRAMEEAGRLYWLDIWTSKGLEIVRTSIMGAPEALAFKGGNEPWVRSLYSTFLNRTAGQSEVNYYLDILNQTPTTTPVRRGGGTPSPPTGALSRIVVLGFVRSPEFRTSQLNAMYQKYFGRSIGPNELNYWMDLLNVGKTLDEIQISLLDSAEYKNRVR
jgi:glucose/arabinose dehydrogenase